MPFVSQHLRALNEAGADIRTLHTLPLRMTVIDGVEAIVPAGALVEGQAAALLVRSELLVPVFRQIFDHYWSAAAQLETGRERRAEVAGDDWYARLSPHHHELIRLLASGLTDEAMARKLGISERTVRRRVGDITSVLGTDSRFQAGVRISQLGWLE
jgi:DNA-binding NarL/FixJ family response regulator